MEFGMVKKSDAAESAMLITPAPPLPPMEVSLGLEFMVRYLVVAVLNSTVIVSRMYDNDVNDIVA